MPGQVKRREVYQDNFYGPLGESAKDAKDEIQELTKELIEQASVLEKGLNKAMFNNIKAINKFLALTKKANKLKREAVVLDKAEERAIKQKSLIEIEAQKVKKAKLQTEAQEIRNSQLLERQKNAQAKAEQRAAKVASEESNAYKQLSKRTREQKNESKRLAVVMINLAESGRRNSKEYRKVASEYRHVTNEAKKADKTLKKIDATVGDNFRSVGDYGKGLDKLKGSLIRIGGALGVFSALRGITGIVVDFDQAQGDLQAISGKTEAQLSSLTDQAKELGATTQFSATEITSMQIELAKLGFTSDQIQNSTKAISNFAAATGADIPAAAKLAGSAMRGFGLDASEMDRVVSTLGVATTKTALDFQSLESGLSTVAPVAKAFGFGIEDTTALLGQLANAGFDASSAATATRNILLNLADANGSLAKELGRPIKNSEDLAGALKELEEKGIDLASALELTDKRSVAAFSTFIEGADSLVDLRDSITDVNKELEDMAEKRLDTIAGQLTLLKSAFEGYILGTSDATQATEKIKNAIASLTKNLPKILKWVGRLVTLFLVYKARLIALNATQKLFNNGAGKMSFNLKTLTSNLRDSSRAGKGLGSALKGIGFGLAITLAFELAQKFWDVASGAERARTAIERLRRANEDASKQATKRISKRQNELESAISEQQRLLDEGVISAEQFLKIKGDLIKATEKQIRADIHEVDQRKQARKEELKELQRIQDEGLVRISQADVKFLEDLGFTAVQGAEGGKQLAGRIAQLTANISAGNVKIKQYKNELSDVTEASKDASSAAKVHSLEIKTGTGEVKKRNTEFKNQIDLMKELNAATTEQIALLDRLREVRGGQELTEMQDLIDAELLIQKIRLETEATFDISKVKELIRERQQLEIDAIIARRDFEISTQEQSNVERFSKMRSDIENERAELLSQDKLTANERAKIEENFQVELRKIGKVEESAQLTLEENIVVIKEQSNNEILDNERATTEEIHDINKELTSDLADLLDSQVDKTKKSEDEKLKAIAEAAKRRRALAKALSDFLDKESDKGISQIDKEIAARQSQADHFESLAEAGNITQEQSIKEQKRRIAELEKQKIAEERAKQRRQLISTTYDVYQSHVQAGDENPLAETITDISLLQALIATIPAFEKGIENTGANGQGLDGKGGFLSMLHPFERVVDQGNNSMIPEGMSNSELAKIANDYDRGSLIHKAEAKAMNGSNWESAALLGKMNELTKAYEDTPDFSSNLEELSDNITYLVTKKLYKNKTIETRRRIQN